MVVVVAMAFHFVSFRFVSFHINVCSFFFFHVRCLVSIYPVARETTQ